MTTVARPPATPARRSSRTGATPGRTALPAAPPSRLADPSLPGTIALTALTLAVGLGFIRIFASARFVLPVMGATVIAHAVSWSCRRRGMPSVPAFLAATGAVLLLAIWVVLGYATTYGIPTPHTFHVAGQVLSRASQRFGTARPPAPLLQGFLLATMLAVGAAGALADWAAFRINATFEAVIPAFTVFLFTCALGTTRHSHLAVAMFVGATLAFLLTHQLSRQTRAGTWFGGRAGRGPTALARAGTAIGVVSVAIGLLLGPRLPWATASPILRYRNGNLPGPTSRSTVSPLVDIRGRLVDNAGVEVFTVKSTVRSYWRLMSLDTFTGVYWASEDRYDPAKGALATEAFLRPDLVQASVTQDYTIEALAAVWLPAAYRPLSITGIKDATYDKDSGSLVTPSDSADGSKYHVVSALSQFDATALAAAPPTVPAAIAARYLTLPSISPRVVAEAKRITAKATSPYAKAKALQDYFRSGYTYDLNARPGHGERAIEQFMFVTKRGYCEQFAGSYGVLARAVGLPTRIAVGFTPGELSGGVFHVRDEHAHAWPEVYLHGFGWVAFEPTPGRGAPGAENYTGAQERQSGGSVGSPSASSTTTPGSALTTPTTAANPTTESTVNQSQSGSRRNHRIFGPVELTVLALLLAVGLWCALIPLLHRRRRALRHRRATTPDLAVLASWDDTTDVLARAGIHRRPAETPAEYARRAGRSAGLQQDTNGALAALARDAASASFGVREAGHDTAASAATTARAVERAITDQLSAWERVGWLLDPRPLLPRRLQRRGVSGRGIATRPAKPLSPLS